ncbi:hypothetical protein HOJ01_03540 [bacterium]|jgi:hypothetical protein|nr:hypothetical protein [bacterium]MBT6293855.1 hypothetical protein [bacterium]
MNVNPLIYDPLNPEYRLQSKTCTLNPSIGVEIESNIVSGLSRSIISNVDLPESFDYEIDPSVVEFNGVVLKDLSPESLSSYMRSNLKQIIQFAESENSIITPFGICPLADNAEHVVRVEDYLDNHPSSSYQKLMERDSGLTTLLTGSSSIQCHIEQTNYDSIVNQNIAHSIFAPFLVSLFANSIVFDGKLTQHPSSRMYNKMQMNFSGSLSIEHLLAGPDVARVHFMDLCSKLSSISPGYYLVRYFRPDLGTIENCTADFQLNIDNFLLFVRLCREISLLSFDSDYIQKLICFNDNFSSTQYLNYLTNSLNNSNFNLLDDFNFRFLLSTLSDDSLYSDVLNLARYPQWRESQSFLENKGVSSFNPKIDSDLMYSYINNFYSELRSSVF